MTHLEINLVGAYNGLEIGEESGLTSGSCAVGQVQEFDQLYRLHLQAILSYTVGKLHGAAGATGDEEVSVRLSHIPHLPRQHLH